MVKFPISVFVYGPSSFLMYMFILAPVSGVPLASLKKGISGCLLRMRCQVLSAAIGHRGPSFWKTSTVTCLLSRLSLGDFNFTCTVVLPDLSVLNVTSFSNNSKSGSKNDSALQSNSWMRNAPDEGFVSCVHV